MRVDDLQGLGEAPIEVGCVTDEFVGGDAVSEGLGEQLRASEVAGPTVTQNPDEATVRTVQRVDEPSGHTRCQPGAAATHEDLIGRPQHPHQFVGTAGVVAIDLWRGQRCGHGITLGRTPGYRGPMCPSATAPAKGDTPRGRVPGPETDRRACLELAGSGWSLTVPWRRRLSGSWTEGGALIEGLGRLDQVHALRVDAEPTGPALDAATTRLLAGFVTRAVARGTFVVGDLPATVARGVAATIPGVAHGRPGDLAFDAAAVRQRREILRPRAEVDGAPTVSVLLPTRRPELLADISAMIRAQTYRRVEVIVAVHGGDPAEVPRPDVGDLPLRVIGAPADRSLGHALALATEAASGDLLTKMDDDDHYGPDHLLDLVLAHEYSGATVVGKSATVVHLEPLDTTVRRIVGTPESLVHRVAGGTILVAAADLRALGGWADVPRAVDSALMRAAGSAGAEIYRPHDIGYVYVRQAGTDHTWSADLGHFLVGAREQWLGLLRHPDFGTWGRVRG